MFIKYKIKKHLRLALLMLFAFLNLPVTLFAQGSCDANGVWLQVLGSGGPDVIQTGRASSSYLVWLNGKARLLIDAGGGSVLNFGKSGAHFDDLDAIVFSHFHVDHSADLPALVKSSYFGDRTRDLPLFGPTGNSLMPSMQEFITALFGEPQGAFHYLSNFIDPVQISDYKLIAHTISTRDHTIWSDFHNKRLQLSAISVHHGPIPTLAWRVDIDGYSITFSGDMNGDNHTLEKLATHTDILLAHNAIPEEATGVARKLHMPPSVIGHIAASANVKQLVLSHRMRRTLGRETETRYIINQTYLGSLKFANDLDCFQP